MAKGLAVISGSNAVVFKALENGVVQMGGSGSWGTTTARVTISGSLTLSGSEGIHLHVSGSEFRLENNSGLSDKIVISGSTDLLADFGAQPSVGAGAVRSLDYKLKGGLKWAATSSAPLGALEDKAHPEYYTKLGEESGSLAPEDFLVITEDGELRRVNKIDASVVMLNDGQTVEQQVGGLNLNLKHSASSDGSIDEKDVNLTKGDLIFKDVKNRTVLSMSNKDELESVEIEFNLDPDLQIRHLSASQGIRATGSIELSGDLNATGTGSFGGDLEVSGKATIDGDLVVKGDLNVWGDTSVTTVGQKNLQIEDAVIHIGASLASSSTDSPIPVDATQQDLGFVFGDENKRALILQDGDLYFGATESDHSSSDILVDYESEAVKSSITLYAPNLSASNLVSSHQLQVGLGGADVKGDLSVSGNVDLGNGDDVVNVKGQLTASNGMKILSGDLHVASGDIDLDGNLDVSGASVLNSTLLVKGAATFDSTVSMTGSLTVAQSASVEGDLSVNGDVRLGSGDEDVVVVSGSLVADHQAEFRGTAVFRDAVTFDSTVDMTGSLAVQQSASIEGDLSVSGNVYLGDVVGQDNVVIKSRLTASSVVNLQGDVTIDNNADLLLKTGSDLKLEEGQLLVTGSLVLTGSEADPLVLKGLTHFDTGSGTDQDILLIDADGKVSQASMLSASQIAVIPDGAELTSSNAQDAFNELQNHINSLSLRIDVGSGSDEARLADGKLLFTSDNANGSDDTNLLFTKTTSTITDEFGNEVNIVKVNLDLAEHLSASSLSASQYIVGHKLTASAGLKVVDGGFDVTGNSKLSGDLTITGDLIVQGTTTVENRNVTTSNLIVEDRIIVVGSGSDPSQIQVGFQLGSLSDDGRVFAIGTQPAVESNTLFLGFTADSDDHLANEFSSSIDVDGFKLKTGYLHLTNDAVVENDVIVTGSLTVKQFVSLESNLEVDGSALIRGALDVTGSLEVSGTLHVIDNVDLDGDLDLAGTGSIHGDLFVDADSTLRGALNVSGAAELSSSLSVGGAVVLGSTLDVDGVVNLNSSLNVTGSVTLKSAVTLGADDNSVNYQGGGSAQTILDNLVKVNGPFRAPIFTHDGVGHPKVPEAWLSPEPQSDYEGYMFYLKGPATNEGIPNSPFPQSNKWYFNENGYWHSSFFWQE